MLCDHCEESGRVPSEKRPGKTVQCPKCKGDGFKLKSYTRTTTYIDVIEDKSNLDKWGDRMVLLGVAMDPKLTNGALEIDRDARDGKDELNRRAQVAKNLAGASDKADKGTFLHGLSELRDMGEHLPPEISFEDVLDMAAYSEVTKHMGHKHMEKLVVHDELKIGGTPDRVSFWLGPDELVAPDGQVIKDNLITDLKTGTTEYGGLKMCMQLAIYSRSKLYDWKTGRRTPLVSVNQDWGIITNVPAGSGEATLYWADLQLGWAAVLVAKEVRRLRSQSRHALTEIVAYRTRDGVISVRGSV